MLFSLSYLNKAQRLTVNVFKARNLPSRDPMSDERPSMQQATIDKMIPCHSVSYVGSEFRARLHSSSCRSGVRFWRREAVETQENGQQEG